MVEETRVPGENHWQTSHKQLYHIILYRVHLARVGFELTTYSINRWSPSKTTLTTELEVTVEGMVVLLLYIQTLQYQMTSNLQYRYIFDLQIILGPKNKKIKFDISYCSTCMYMFTLVTKSYLKHVKKIFSTYTLLN